MALFSRSKNQAAHGQHAAQGGAIHPDDWKASTSKLAMASKAATYGLWALVISGPLLGAFALVSAGASPEQTTSQEAVVTKSSTGPEAFAVRYISASLRAGKDAMDEVRTFYPTFPDLKFPPNSRTASQITPLQAREVTPGHWSVIVAADVLALGNNGRYAPDGTHYYQISVLAVGGPDAGGAGKLGSQAAYIATSMPAETGAPPQLGPPALAYRGNQLTSGPIVDLVSGYLRAYLTGIGDLSRFTTFPQRPISPPPYTTVTIKDLITSEQLDNPNGVPDDDATLRVLVSVEVTDRAGRIYPLSYALTLTARGGRWEVTARDPVPALADPQATPTIAPPPTQQSGAPSTSQPATATPPTPTNPVLPGAPQPPSPTVQPTRP